MLFLRESMATFHHKTVPLTCPQNKECYEKMLEDVTSYTPRYMEEMEAIFEQSQEEEKKRIDFLKQAFLSIHRHLDVTNNERWAGVHQRPGCWESLRMDGFIHLSVVINIQLHVPVSVWRRCTVSSIKLWCPSMTRMISNGGRTTEAPACPPTGRRLRCGTKLYC